MDNDNVFYLYVHNKGQMWFPKNDLIFGSTFIFKNMRQGNNYWQTFAITRTHWKALDLPSKRCDEDNQVEANTTTCITRYIERSLVQMMSAKIILPHPVCIFTQPPSASFLTTIV